VASVIVERPDLSDVHVVVTGATSGLGLAMADALLAAGATVAMAARPTSRLDDVVADRLAEGLPALALPLEVRDPASVESAVASASERLGRIDLLINNAGIGMRTVNTRFMSDPRPFYEVSPDGFAHVVATNLTGYFLVARAVAPRMVEQGRGRIVNVTMNHETMTRRGFVPYGPSRAGAEALSLIMTEDLRPHGVSVNLLLPGGATETGMIPDDVPAATRKRLLQASVMGPPAVWLASPESEGVTGQRIVARDFGAWLGTFRAGR
jgi:NAD(P)-dependent dehydrogenase (short-subunit alcohol dehydrogenase family)